MMLMAGADKSVAFGKYPARVGKYEVWSDVVASDAMQAMLAASRLQMGEGTVNAEGKTNVATFDIDTLGLGASWTRLLSSCPANTTPPAAATSNLNITCPQFRPLRCSRDSGEVSARRAIDRRPCNCMQLH